MFSKNPNFLRLALIAAASLVTSVAWAAPATGPLKVDRQSDVIDVRIKCNDWGDCDRVGGEPDRRRPKDDWRRPNDRVGFDRDRNRDRYRDRDWYRHRDYDRPRWRPRPYWNGPVFIEPQPRIIYRPAPRVIYEEPPVVIRPAYSSAHVRWCLNRYQSYNPRTNRFLSYDGYWKVCRSPYSY